MNKRFSCSSKYDCTIYLDLMIKKLFKISSSVDLIYIKPTRVTIMGKNNQFDISFKLSYIKDENVIALQAIYKNGSSQITSSLQKINKKVFCDMFAATAYKQNDVDDERYMIELKDAAVSEINARMIDEGTLLSGVEFNGIGFVILNDKKILTIEKIKLINDLKEKHQSIQLIDCVGLVSLENVSGDYTVEFYAEKYKLAFKIGEVTAFEDGTIKQYTLKLEKYDVYPDESQPVFEKINCFDHTDGDLVDEFYSKRYCLLNANATGFTKNLFDDDDF